jgi:hypothetical protein
MKIKLLQAPIMGKLAHLIDTLMDSFGKFE